MRGFKQILESKSTKDHILKNKEMIFEHLVT